MIRLLEQHMLQIDEIARNLHRYDLPGTVARDLLTIGEAIYQKGAARWRFAIPDKVAGWLHFPDGNRQVADRLAIIVG